MESVVNGGGDNGETGWDDVGSFVGFDFEGVDGFCSGTFGALPFAFFAFWAGFVATFAAFENVVDSATGASDFMEERVTRLVGCESGEDSIALRFLGGIWNGKFGPCSLK
jgi:hypothetical protein